ncbi:class C sortase [Bacillus cytotoxicus]|uniref:Sortase family protein n=1 Tax=Bacillus cytotoxicus (strain DSM 22905 / CIP 110041 / 391-98 / NVH 391-98) TaxID=315749 RepID=A7GT79_BACCN|nr:class C sortase [Bacillus cytotoxicus]ABS23337.1 sortase family protein [Bacillus cytotoxicus NVH 391-98]AWC45964.1 class C sortase [Bacillus cytotoxicus]MDH2865094.1 class C sortase [Bacillus cytotoxicus]MDH2883975.1 class C sortase [Bacillus cytotoxicus]NZD32796.1 class C sortase [Bacillus cytotoxicus]
MKRNIVFGVFVLGLSIFLYPTISNWLATRAHYSEINSYDKKIKSLQKKEIERRKMEAAEYNKQVQNSTQTFSDPFAEEQKSNQKSYVDALNLGDVMGYIEIPKIDEKLPIYQGTSEEVLSRGVGHLDRSSLPVGGKSTHTVLTGHRGLPSAKLFTDLDKLVEGDLFYIHSLNNILAYEVDQIKVVLPHETDDLLIAENQDYTTLVTCTPYGSNTHRLLIRGERVEYSQKEKERQEMSNGKWFDKWIIIVPIILLCTFLFAIYKRRISR